MEESSLTFSEVSTQGGNFSTAMGDGDLRAHPVGDINSGIWFLVNRLVKLLNFLLTVAVSKGASDSRPGWMELQAREVLFHQVLVLVST